MENALAPKEQMSRALKSRIRRRAYQLSNAVYNALIDSLVAEIKCGKLPDSAIENWRPNEVPVKALDT